jgi:hypothetical protein
MREKIGEFREKRSKKWSDANEDYSREALLLIKAFFFRLVILKSLILHNLFGIFSEF